MEWQKLDNQRRIVENGVRAGVGKLGFHALEWGRSGETARDHTQFATHSNRLARRIRSPKSTKSQIPWSLRFVHSDGVVLFQVMIKKLQ